MGTAVFYGGPVDGGELKGIPVDAAGVLFHARGGWTGDVASGSGYWAYRVDSRDSRRFHLAEFFPYLGTESRYRGWPQFELRTVAVEEFRQRALERFKVIVAERKGV